MELIRQLAAEDMEESLRLSQFAFQYELSPADKEERLKHLNPEDTHGVFVDGRLAAKLTVLPLAVMVNGSVLPMGGIAGVATWPEYRRSGYVAKLLADALERMRAAGQTLSFLAPFSFAFYRKFGWEMLTEYKRYEVAVQLLPRFAPEEGRIERTGDWTVLDAVYKPYAARFNGMLARDERWWKWNILTLQKKGHSAVYYDSFGTPRGYMLYQVKERKMTVFEFVFLDEAARRALWRFIANHDSMLDMVEMQADAEDALPFLLDNPRVKQEMVPYFMVRIVDAERFLAQVALQEGAAGSFALKLEDAYASWNNGYYRLDANGSGKVSVSRFASENEGEAVPWVECDIRTLSTMLLGYRRPTFLKAIGRLRGDDRAVELLDALIPRRSTYLLDFF